jgi:16S rRNA (adenine1518-N6/adenine1519-N6)-dimethyltransferase
MKQRRRAPLGQVFLADRRVEERIVDVLPLQPEDMVLEIGAGPGNMTERLAERAAKVLAVEVDRKLAAALREKFAGNSRVEVIEADILKVPIDDLARAAGRERLQVFGNLPYYITSPCLLHLFQYHASIREMVLMVQLEVARRIAAQPGSADYGLLSVTCQYYTQPKLLFTIPPRAFRPRPQVDSALVRMTVAPQRKALGVGEETIFWKWMRAAFSQKRKTLVNNWKSLCDADRLRAGMREMGIDPRARAEALSLAQLAELQRVACGSEEAGPADAAHSGD